MPNVLCSVSNCNYWETGSLCNADAIHVDVDMDTKNRMTEEFGDELGQMNLEPDKARDKAETCCHTFVERGR